MRKIIAALLLALLPSLAVGQSITPFPQTLPPNTVVGRTGISPGPAQAIPFSTLFGLGGGATFTTPSVAGYPACFTNTSGNLDDCGKKPLAASLTLHFSTSGNDSTGTGTVANPFRTMCGAYTYALATLNLNGHTLTIQADGPGTYSCAMSYSGMLQGQTYPTQVLIQGDTSGDPLNAVNYRWDAPVAAGPQSALTVAYGGGVQVRGFAFDNRTAVAADITSAGIFLNIGDFASIWTDNVVFLWNGGQAYVNAQVNSYWLNTGNIGIYSPQTSATGSTNNLSTTVGVSGISGPPIVVGSGVSGTGIPAGAYVTAINANPPTSITISAAATATGSPTLTFTDHVTSAIGVGEFSYFTNAAGGNLTNYISLSGNPRMVYGFIFLDKGWGNFYGMPVFQAETLQPLTATAATAGSPTVTVNSTAAIATGYYILASFAPVGTTITVVDPTTITMSANATANVSTPTAIKIGSAPAQINGPQVSLWETSTLTTAGTSSFIPGTAYIIGGAHAAGSVTSGSQIDDVVRTVTGPNTSTTNRIPKWSNTRDLLADSSAFFNAGGDLALTTATGLCLKTYEATATNYAGLCSDSSGNMFAKLGITVPTIAGGWLADGGFRLTDGNALATNAIVKFALAPGMPGTASGTPTNASAGAIPFVFDTSNNRCQWYSGSWRQCAMVADIGATIQGYDSDLAALAALSSTGLAARTGSGTWAVRTLTGPAAGISVSNGDGVSGNPTLALANDLAALEGLGSTGIAVRSASDTWVQRSIAGTANEITATNGDGVSGNPTLSLPTALTFTGKTVTGGTFATITASGTWAASGTWTLPAFTLGGTVSGGGNQINNVIIGTSTPLAGTFTTATANAFVPNSSSVPSNGMYLPASNTLGWAVNSAAEVQLTASAFSPATSNGNALGTGSLMWADLFLASGGVINWNNGEMTLEQSGATTLTATATTFSVNYSQDANTQISAVNQNPGASASASLIVGSSFGNFIFQQYSAAAGGSTNLTVPTDGHIYFDMPGSTGGTFTVRATNSFTTLFDITPTGIITMPANVSSTTTGTGTLVVTGGVGLSQNLNVGGTAAIGSSLSTTTFASIGTKIRAAGSAPAVSSCGTTPSISGSDLAGLVTTGTGTPTSCTITFNAAYASEPYCVVRGKVQAQVTDYTVSTTAIVVTTTATNNVPIIYHCIARSAGWLLKRDLEPAANDNTPAFMEKAA